MEVRIEPTRESRGPRIARAVSDSARSLERTAAISDWDIPSERERGGLNDGLVLHMIRNYNTFLRSILQNATAWTVADGERQIIAVLEIMLSDVTPHKLSEIVEQQIRTIITEWMVAHGLLDEADAGLQEFGFATPGLRALKRNDFTVELFADGDIAFWQDASWDPKLRALLVVNGALDPAAALEQHAAAISRFSDALAANPGCETILLSVADPAALQDRIGGERLMARHWSILPLLASGTARNEFFEHLFRSTLGLL